MIIAKDVIAMLCIVGGFSLMAIGINSVVGAVVISIVAYYFGGKNSLFIDKNKK